MSPNGLAVEPLLTWINVFVICTLLLGVETVAVVVMGWLWQLSWRSRASALVPLAASICTGIIALHIHDLFNYWFPRDFGVQDNYYGPPPQSWVHLVLSGVARAVQEATVLGWLVVIVTGILLALGLVGLWQLGVLHPNWRGVQEQPARY